MPLNINGVFGYVDVSSSRLDAGIVPLWIQGRLIASATRRFFSMTLPTNLTYGDIVDGFARLPVASALALEELRDRYRRSYIGLSWVLVSFIAFILVKQLVFAQIFEMEGYDFLSHLVIGFALFNFISSIFRGGAALFVMNRTWLLSSNFPYTLYINKLILKSIIELFLLTIASAIMIISLGDVRPGALWSVPLAIIFYFLSAYGTCLLLAPLGAMFRDGIYAVQTMTRILFFATPIIWLPTPGTIRGEVAKWNPLTYYIQIIREPLMVGEVSWIAWLVVFCLTALLLCSGALVFAATRKKVAYWL